MTETNPNIAFVNPPTMPAANGYSHIAEVNGGRTIYISGQVAVDRAGRLVGPGDLRVQAIQVFTNIRTALEAVDAGFNDVVKLNFYLLDIHQIGIVREVRDQFVSTEDPPTSAAVEVRRLVRDEFLIEVEAIAILS